MGRVGEGRDIDLCSSLTAEPSVGIPANPASVSQTALFSQLAMPLQKSEGNRKSSLFCTVDVSSMCQMWRLDATNESQI